MSSLRDTLGRCVLPWSHRLARYREATPVGGQAIRVLVFFHGDSLAHTVRPSAAAASAWSSRDRGGTRVA